MCSSGLEGKLFVTLHVSRWLRHKLFRAGADGSPEGHTSLISVSVAFDFVAHRSYTIYILLLHSFVTPIA
jgi:hypothetical protein